MARRDAQHDRRIRRRGPRGAALWAPSMLVAALLASAAAADHFQWGPTYLGWKGGDPNSDPAAVQAPGVLGLGAVPVAGAVGAEAPEAALVPDAVRAAVAKLSRSDALGRNVVVTVAGLDGVPVFATADDQVVPASTTKVLTAVAALQALGPAHRFSTTVEQGTDLSEIVLVGGGDPFLMAEPVPMGSFPERADLTTLARATADALNAAGISKVRLRYDTALFEGPSNNPAWEPGYVPDQVVSPITPLWVDSGKDPSGWGRVDDPAAVAAARFAEALEDAGVAVGPPKPGAVVGTARRVAEVRSAPVSQIVERVLDVSDNEGAEVLARHVGLAVDDDGSFVGGTDAVLSTLEGLGVDVSGAEVLDGSGLSRRNSVRPATLLQSLAVAASDDHPHLRSAIDGLPVAGFTGSLASRFASDADEGLGRVKAKTGTLTGVHLLAGVVTGADGVPMLFVAGADQVKVENTLEARATLDRIAARLGGCACATPAAETEAETDTDPETDPETVADQ